MTMEQLKEWALPRVPETDEEVVAKVDSEWQDGFHKEIIKGLYYCHRESGESVESAWEKTLLAALGRDS